jgi:hypothetical protein
MRAFEGGDFAQTLKAELLSKVNVLPLQKAVSQSGIVDAGNVGITVLHFDDLGDCLQVSIGVFFTEIVGGCSCGDEPFPANGYCEMELTLDKKTAVVEFAVMPS